MIFNLKSIDEKKILDLLIFLTLVVFYIKIFHLYDHYPLLDEVIVLDRYLEWKSFLRKDHIGNHTINSFIGVILKSLFGYNFELLRFISFFCFGLILFIFRTLYKRIYLYILFLSLVTFSNLLFNYIYIFRGYYVHALLCAASFLFLKKYFFNGREQLIFNIILLLIFLQLAHSLFTIYVAIPVFILILFDNYKNKSLLKNTPNYIFFLILPVISIYLLYMFLDGFVTLYSGNLNFDFLIENFSIIFIECIKQGFKMIFFSSYTETNYYSFFDTVKMLYNGYDYILVAEPIILLIYFLSISFSIFNILSVKNFSYLDFLILIMFFFFILIFKTPTLRVHVGSAIFCLFYIINNLDIIFEKIKILNIKSYYFTSILICFLLILSVSPNKNFQQLKDHVIKIDKYKHDCDTANVKLNSSEKWVLINFYPNICKYRYDAEIQDNYIFN